MPVCLVHNFFLVTYSVHPEYQQSGSADQHKQSTHLSNLPVPFHQEMSYRLLDNDVCYSFDRFVFVLSKQLQIHSCKFIIMHFVFSFLTRWYSLSLLHTMDTPSSKAQPLVNTGFVLLVGTPLVKIFNFLLVGTPLVKITFIK